MRDLLERLRNVWEGLNERERRLFAVLGALFSAFLLGFPLLWTTSQNSDIEDHNEQLRGVLELIAKERPRLQQLADARRTATARYANKTPPLGSFLEGEASKHGLTLREVTDQPEKSTGNYRRRSATASIVDADLTAVVNLLSGIVASAYPVAIQQVQIEHYQPGDKYRLSFGVVTFDRKTETAKTAAGATRGDSAEDG